MTDIEKRRIERTARKRAEGKCEAAMCERNATVVVNGEEGFCTFCAEQLR